MAFLARLRNIFRKNKYQIAHKPEGLPLKNPQLLEAVKWLNKIETGLWNHPEKIAEIPENQANKVVSYFLGLACLGTNISNIMIGRHFLWKLPKVWAIDRIDKIAENEVDLNDEWEYRRLLEVYEKLDEKLLKKWVNIGSRSENPEVKEAAEDFS